MKNSSLSLISALYNYEGVTDLYKEIYYPIIRYSVTAMYLKDDVDASHYYALTQLNQVIKDLFDIDIPTLVLGRAVQRMGKEYGIKFEYYSDTTSFKIVEINGDVSNADVETVANAIDTQLDDLEKKFQSFLKVEGLDCEKSFFDFFADSEKAIECYLNHRDGQPIVNEEYVNLARFIQWTTDYDEEAYNLVKRVLWGSIIAGFLQRKNDALGINAISTVTYYIDTSLVFALLGYDTIDNVNYARELISEILASGATPTVHPLTREELNLILESIEHQGAPDPGTVLGEAYYREKKHMSDLLHLRKSMYEILTKQYKLNCPVASRDKIECYRRDYKNHEDVQMLRDKWNEKANEDFREIHDVVLCEIVNKENKFKKEAEKFSSYFVTKNADLIDIFGKRIHTPAVIHPGSVIMNLWIHSAQSKNFKQAILTEIITRCLAMNQTDAQRRLRIFEKYAQEAGLTPQDFNGMYTELIRRSTKTINSSDAVMENEAKETVKVEIQIELIKSIAEETAEAVYQRHQQQNEQKAAIDSLSAQKQKLEESGRLKDETISNLQATIQEQVNAYMSEKEAQEQEIQRQKKLAALYKRLGKASEEQSRIKHDRESYVTDTHFWCAYIVQIVMIATIIGAVGYIVTVYFLTGKMPEGISWAIASPTAMLFVNLFLNHLNFPLFSSIKVGLSKDRERQFNDWNLMYKERIEKNEEEMQKLIEQILEIGGDISE